MRRSSGTAKRNGRLMVLGGATLALWLAAAPPATAQVFPFALPFMPDSTVGETVEARILLRYNGGVSSLTISAIDVYPSCTEANDDCNGGVANAEAGVLDLAPGAATNGTATGTTTDPGGNDTCTGAWSLVPDNPDPNLAKKWRFVPPGGEGTLAINETEDCTVRFPALVLRVPTNDVGGAPGVGTRMNVGMTTSGTGTSRQGGFNVYNVAAAAPPAATSAPSTTSTSTTTPSRNASPTTSAPPTGGQASAQQGPTTSAPAPSSSSSQSPVQQNAATTTTSPGGRSATSSTEPLPGTGSPVPELVALAALLAVLGAIVVHRHQHLAEVLAELQRGSG